MSILDLSSPSFILIMRARSSFSNFSSCLRLLKLRYLSVILPQNWPKGCLSRGLLLLFSAWPTAGCLPPVYNYFYIHMSGLLFLDLIQQHLKVLVFSFGEAIIGVFLSLPEDWFHVLSLWAELPRRAASWWECQSVSRRFLWGTPGLPCSLHISSWSYSWSSGVLLRLFPRWAEKSWISWWELAVIGLEAAIARQERARWLVKAYAGFGCWVHAVFQTPWMTYIYYICEGR